MEWTARQKRLKRPLRLSDLTAGQKAYLRKQQRKWERLMAPIKEAIRRSGQITAKDLAIVINAKPDGRSAEHR